MNFTQTKIDTTGAKQLHQIKTQTCNDTWQLFTDLQTKNPYTSQMRDRLGDSFNKLYNQLLPKHVKANVLTVGIQGGEGSFNEQALQSLQQSTLSDESIDTKYLYTTKNVLDHLHRGEIDLGLFAIQNSVGGLVQESIEACAKHRFDIHHKFEILISHHLMKLPNITDDKINKIMAHPQVLKQCRTTLIDRYPDVEIVSGQGELIDTATAAKALAAQNGEISSTIAILGPKILSDIYDLEIIDSDLQDNQNNLTEFILASRPGWQDL